MCACTCFSFGGYRVNACVPGVNACMCVFIECCGCGFVAYIDQEGCVGGNFSAMAWQLQDFGTPLLSLLF